MAKTETEADGQKTADFSSSRNDRNSSLLETTKASKLFLTFDNCKGGIGELFNR